MRDRFETELKEAKAQVKSNPWPWLVGGYVLGVISGAMFF